MSRRSSIREVELQDARESLRNIRRISEESIYGLREGDSEKGFSIAYLRRRFAANNELEKLFNRYTERLNRAYFSLYLLLQAFFGISHFILVLVINASSNTLQVVSLDLVFYSLTGLMSLIIVYLNEGSAKNHASILKYSTISIFSFIFVSDLGIPIYYNVSSISAHLRPTYTTQAILACYVFANISNNLYAFLFGLFVTTCHMLVLGLITYQNNEFIWQRLGSDLTYLLCINGIGICFRIANELVTRRAFLDHRGCVESTLKLKFEKEQEEQLMLSIIPEHIIKEVRRDIINKIEYVEKMFKLPTSDPTEIPYIRKYDNVTVLYADIVNYTAMTSKLPVKLLVETLNDLFSGFDDASEELNVLRIKFLGDCYYSVAGLPPNPAPNHAEACIDLGLRMISIIRIVREKRELTIDMRIGVHSGKILSGLLGSTKWQFDIWSTDAHIANKMETAGEAGHVHITQQTYDLIKKTYNIVPTQRGSTNSNLIPFNLTTYLISPETPPKETSQPIAKSPRKSILKKMTSIEEIDSTRKNDSIRFDIETGETHNGSSLPSILDTTISNNNGYNNVRYERRESLRTVMTPIESIISRRPSVNPTPDKRVSKRRVTPCDIKRRTAFMDNNIKQYLVRLRNTNEKLEEAIDELPLTKYEQWFKGTDINPFFLVFKDKRLEKDYLLLRDPLFKYYLIIYVVLFVAKIFIQNLTLLAWDWESWVRYTALVVVVCILIPLTWIQPLWSKYFANKYEDDNDKPKSYIMSILYRISSTITSNVFVRTGIYLVLCGFFIASVLDELIECKQIHQSKHDNVVNYAALRILMVRNQQQNDLPEECVIPWHMSHTLCLAVIMCFSFVHIHIWLKLLIAAGTTVFYSIYVWNFTHYRYYKDSETFNYMMEPQIAHIMGLVYLTITLHMVDRQTEYLNRLDHQWTAKLMSEQVEVNTMHKITTMLLKNILPIHVAELYLDVNRPTRDELYTEEYRNVCVIFASVVDFYMDSSNEELFLGFINQIIKEFDLLLLKQRQQSIEKIKVTNMTYMAACGLDPGRKDSYGTSEASGEHVAVTMVKFAVDMIAALDKINREGVQECKLRIGICHGEVMAGVVGSKKPLYDIWGDTVNLASRMDSNGVPGKIQITKNTAQVLENYGIKCEFRDFIYVKGKEHRVPTYFVALNQDDKLVYL